MRGRKPSSNPLIFKTVGLTAGQWEWLSFWLPSSSPTSQLRELFDRAFKFWPGGPFVFRNKLSGCVSVAGSAGSDTHPELLLQNRHSLSSVRVIVSPVLTAKNGSNRQIESDWKLK